MNEADHIHKPNTETHSRKHCNRGKVIWMCP